MNTLSLSFTCYVSLKGIIINRIVECPPRVLQGLPVSMLMALIVMTNYEFPTKHMILTEQW